MDQFSSPASVKSKPCKCGRPRRPGQRNCAICHAASKKESRARKAARVAALERLFAAGAFDPETKRRFEQKFSSRLVVVLARPNSDDPDYCGYATGFKPGNMVVVEYSEGKTVEAELERLCPDPALHSVLQPRK